MLAAGAAAVVAACGPSAADGEGVPRDVTILSGTVLQLTLSTPLASDTSEVEDAVAAEVTDAVMVGGRTALPSGALVSGTVRAVDPSDRVKGRARLSLEFTSVTSGGRRYAMSAERFSREASAAQGAAVGGGAGARVVLATRGEDVRFPSGTEVSIQLAAPLTVRVSR